MEATLIEHIVSQVTGRGCSLQKRHKRIRFFTGTRVPT